MNSKLVATFILLIYCAMIPLWVINATWYHVIVFCFMYWFMCDCIQSLFMHRWAAHKLWNPPVWVQYAGSFIGVLALVGSPIGWAAWHRTHHVRADTERDPHAPAYKSIWYIVFKYKYHTAEVKRAVDMLRNKWFVWILKYETPIVIVGNLVLWAALPLQWFLTLWALPVAFMIINTNYFINVLHHKDGKPINRPWMWPILFSEVYHGSHHNEPRLNYTKYDPAGWIVTKLKWTKDETN